MFVLTGNFWYFASYAWHILEREKKQSISLFFKTKQKLKRDIYLPKLTQHIHKLTQYNESVCVCVCACVCTHSGGLCVCSYHSGGRGVFSR